MQAINEPRAVLYYPDERTKLYFSFFCAGFIVYAAAYGYSAVSARNYVIALPFQSIGIILLVAGASQLIKFNFQNNYLKYLFFSYCTWLCLVIMRGFSPDYQFIKDMLFDAEHGVFIYLVPLTLLFPQKIFFYKKIFKVIVILAAVFILYTIVFIDNILYVKDYFLDLSSSKWSYDYLTKILSVPIGFILLTYSYHSDKTKLFAIFAIVVTVLFAIIRARRALIFLSVSPLIFAAILHSFFSERKRLLVPLYLLIATAVLVLAFKVSHGSRNGIFSLLMERLDEDSRTGVEQCFYADMTPKDWIIGRGIEGEYYCPNIDLNDVTGYRGIIETDYLNIILKGGMISLGLLLLIAIPAMIKGLFYSKNLLSRAAGVWIFLWILELYPATVYSFSLNYFLVWMSIGICYNEGIRNMPESEMKSKLLAAGRAGKRLKPLNI